jgi:hypothetical protein
MEKKLDDFLIWETNLRQKEIIELHKKHRDLAVSKAKESRAHYILQEDLIDQISWYFVENSCEIAKEKEDIFNIPTDYDKDYILRMFKRAGFHSLNNPGISCELVFWEGNNSYPMLEVEIDDLNNQLKFILHKSMVLNLKTESVWIDFQDRKRINYYYDKFICMFMFEVGEGVK